MNRVLLLFLCFLTISSEIEADSSEESSSSESSMTEADISEQVTVTPTASPLFSTIPFALNLSESNCSEVEVQILCREYLTKSQRDFSIEKDNTTTVNLNDFLERYGDSNNNFSNKKNAATGFEDDYHPEPHFNFESETEEVWRTSMSSMEQRNEYMLTKNILTDCTFEVGKENNTQVFRGHKLLFARASLLFETIFNGTNTDRIKMEDISPKVFEYVKSFVYSGSACLTSFSEACELLQTASRLQLPELMQHCRAFLWANLYPNNVWRGYQCAQAANDDIFKEAALQIIEWKTDDALNDPAFTEIPQSALVAFLARDDLNLRSEVKLYEACLRWAISEASRRSLPQEPESLRQVLGNALGLIRFLTFTPSEFANIQATSRILTYGESMSLIFNLNSPGVIEMPKNLSTNNKTRVCRHPPSYFKVVGSDSGMKNCNNREQAIATQVNTFDLYTTTVPNKQKIRKLNVIAVQIPTQIHCRTFLSDSNTKYEISRDSKYQISTIYDEDLTIYVIKNNISVEGSIHFQGDVKCNDLITVNFSKTISIYYDTGYHGNSLYDYKIKVILNKSGRYPLSWSDEAHNYRRDDNPRRDYINENTVYYWYFENTDFVYSMITEDY